MTTGYNSFQTFASESFRASEGGTVIEGRFSAHPGFRIGYWAWGCLMIFVWLTTLIGLLIMFFFGSINRQTLSSEPVFSKLIVLVVIVAPAFVYAFGRLGAPEEAEKLRRFLRETLEACED